MIVAPVRAGTFSQLPECTWSTLQSLGVCAVPLAPEFALLDGKENEVNQLTANWYVGPDGNPCAECRILHIQGKQEEFVHTLIYPARPERSPLFVALMWQDRNGCCEAYIDLATPGMSVDWRDEVSEMATALSIRHAAFLPRARNLPAWARLFTQCGLHVHCDGGHNPSARLTQAYEDYLNAWLDFADVSLHRVANDVRAQRELLHYKRELEALAPGQEVLYRLFGEEWSSRSFGEFLYR